MLKWLHQIWKVLISLKFAVVVIISLTVSLIAATLIESNYDTKTAQFLVYRSWWFFVLLSLLGALILAVAISRLPWKKKHIPFLMAHAGILMILGGSWVTYTRGLDGNVQLTEGEVNSVAELDEQVLVFKKQEREQTQSFPWMPPYFAEKFKGKSFQEFGVQVDRFISDSVPRFQFEEIKSKQETLLPNEKFGSAIQIKILGAPMGGAPEFWLWTGDPAWSTQKLGPARFLIRSEKTDFPEQAGEARIDFIVRKNGVLRYEAISPRGEKKSGTVFVSSKKSFLINPGWKMPIQVQVKSFVHKAVNRTEYVQSKVRSENPVPAISISLIDNPSSRLWLGLGDRAQFTDRNGDSVSLGYFPKRVILPFALFLREFVMKNNPGTMDPASYASYVQVIDGLQKTQEDLENLPVHTIQMNEPLKVKEYTFYQASYVPDFPKITTTILTVNYDPGRFLKYGGSLLLVLGAIFLYLSKVMVRRKLQKV